MVNKLTNILIHVECFHILEGDLTSNVVLNQLFIHPQRSATYNDTKPDIAVSKLIGFNEVTWYILEWQNKEGNDVWAVAKNRDTRHSYRMWKKSLGKCPLGKKNLWGIIFDRSQEERL
jgi:hypothetical protein